MILDWLGFILLAWLITGLITGVAEIITCSKEYVLDFCRKQESYGEVRLYFTDDYIYKIMSVLIVLGCVFIGFLAVPHYYKVVKEVRQHKEEQNS